MSKEVLKMNKDETIYLLDMLYNFYKPLDTLQKYYMKRKYERLNKINFNNYKNDIFNNSNISPDDMEIDIKILNESIFNSIVQSITSIPIESQIGRRLNIAVLDKKTNKYLGFIRLTSPVSSILGRNLLLNNKKTSMSKINNHIYSGSVIVPVQPFGYNYLGGKLLALICVSNEVKNEFNRKYKSDVCMFETTSLYGDMKSSSQYDGLEPYIKRNGKTNSDVLLYPNDDVYISFRNVLRKHYGQIKWGGSIANNKSGPKKNEFNKGIQLLNLHIIEFYPELIDKMNELKSLMKVKSKKNYYYSTLGNNNTFDYISNDNVLKLNNNNKNKFDLNELIKWWKVKSSKRYNKLKIENKLRNDLEFYTKGTIKNGINFDMIR